MLLPWHAGCKQTTISVMAANKPCAFRRLHSNFLSRFIHMSCRKIVSKACKPCMGSGKRIMVCMTSMHGTMKTRQHVYHEKKEEKGM